MEQYIVKWKDNKTGDTGQGNPTSKAVAEEWVRDGNKRNLIWDMVFWMEPASGEGETAATTSQDDYETWTLDGNGRAV